MEVYDVEAYKRLVSDVCNVFREVTGAEADPRREAGVIVPFAREFKWETFDFRLLIEYEFSNPRTREYLNQPGRMNLRAIFNPNRKEILLDTVADLRRAKEIQKKASSKENESPDFRTLPISLACCGGVFDLKYIKVPDGKSFRWKKANIDEYDKHFSDCVAHSQLMSVIQVG